MKVSTPLLRMWRNAAGLTKAGLLGAAFVLAVITGSMEPAQAMDTDIFDANTSSTTAPNVLIILDNTSNWSRQNQHFPGGVTQGQAEVDALKTALSELPGNINVGIMEFPTGGRNDTGGFIRFAMKPVGTSDTNGATNVAALSAILTTIYNNINDPTEKVNSGQAYGDLMYDAYNYFAGLTPYATSSDVRSDKADSDGYSTNYTKFKSPLSSTSTCGNTYIIFIGNPNAQGPIADSATNLAALKAVGGDTTQIKLPNYTLTTQTLSDNLGYSSACYTTTPTTIESSFTSTCSGYDSCSYNTGATTTALAACATGYSRYSVIQTTPNVTSSTTTTTTTTNTGTTNSCYYDTSSWSASADTGTVPSCPASTSTTSGNTTTNTSYTCSYSVGSTGSTTGCSSVSKSVVDSAVTSTSLSNSCYSSANSWSSSDKGTLSCPATTTTTSGGTTTKTVYSCTYSAVSSGVTTGCNGNKTKLTVTQTATPTTTTTGQQYKFPVTQTVTKTVTTGTTSGSTQTTLGNTYACYSSQAACSTSDYTCPSGSTCACSATAFSGTAVCPSGARYQVLGNYSVQQETPVNPPTYTTDTATYNADEWARFLHQTGVPVGSTTVPVSVYTIDVYYAQPNSQQSALLSSMARNGGGTYFSAQSESAILAALRAVFAEIQAKNNTFASAALPISATNRAQNSNQVYIGMFRPTVYPRWFGNLKRYQIGTVGGFSVLVGADNNAAVSNTTGFVTPCAQSFWTTDSSGYWYDTTNDISRIFITKASVSGTSWTNAANDDAFSKGTCSTATQWSDLPDGPSVEKGGAAEMMRNYFASRTMYTVSSSTGTTTPSASDSSVSTFDTSITGLSATSTVNTNIAKFIMGQDVTGEIALSASTSARPSIHGDVVHSRPLPVDYGGTNGVVIYYGANDGLYRAVDGSTGKEKWSFVAPESYSYLQRQMDNSPLVLTPNPTPSGITPTPGATGRDFFFDGSTGLYQNSDSSKVWIYPSMRRGGRMLYAFNVTDPTTAPKVKWRRGCQDLTADTNCTSSEFKAIGQTWSTPQVAKVNGYKSGSTYMPVIIVGGGYDTCEDADSTSPSCTSPKGSVIYILDADTGAVLKTFTLSDAYASARSVAADLALIDTNNDGVVDYAYAADTGGNIYRIDFPSNASGASDWTVKRVAYTSGAYRKFLFAPALLAYKGQVYVAIVSGDREHPLAKNYPYTTPVLNRAYVYLDDPSRATVTDLDGNKMLDKSSGTPDCTSATILPNGDYYGWHMDLKAGTGEQGVTSALIFGGMVTFSTNRPTGAAETCTTSLGEARGYLVNLLNGSGAIGVTGTCGGTQSSVFVGGGLPPSAVAATVTVNGKEQTILIGAPDKSGGTSTSIGAQQVKPPITSTRSRTYWKMNSDNK